MISSKWARALEVGIHLNSTLERLAKGKKIKCLETIFQVPSESDSTHTLKVFKII